MRILTSNIWGDYFGNPVEYRDKQLLSVYNTYKPDIIGFQEVTVSWYNSVLFKELSHDYFIVGSDLYDRRNFTPIAVDKNHFFIREYGVQQIKDCEDFDTDKSKAITYAVLDDKTTRNTFGVCNTHFWWKVGERHDNMRSRNALQLVKCMDYIQDRYQCNVFAFGDMNAKYDSPVFSVYKEHDVVHLNDVSDDKAVISSFHGDPVIGDDMHYHGHETTDGFECSFDHIVGKGDGFKVTKYSVITDRAALDATDHSPVYADIELK